MDRITDDGPYRFGDVCPILSLLNFAKSAFQEFKTKEAFKEYAKSLLPLDERFKNPMRVVHHALRPLVDGIIFMYRESQKVKK
ncbi:hypothetical protein HDU96_004559 [Phlyctochytrium bullatum]|nr:hypothetical protein HDU96_004559 [Phlyctochytrium bullatum]